MVRLWIPALVTLSVVAAAVAHGTLTGRWHPLPPLDEYTSQLTRVPLVVGEWSGVDVPLADADDLGRAGIAGHLHRRYVQSSTQEAVTVLLVCGRPGPISVHTPDVCYRSAGYTAVGDPGTTAVPLGNRTVAFHFRRFAPPAGRIGARDLEIRWAWDASNGVSAPDNPRLTFAREPALYKLYVIRELRAAKVAGPDPAEQFLAIFAPELEEALRTSR